MFNINFLLWLLGFAFLSHIKSINKVSNNSGDTMGCVLYGILHTAHFTLHTTFK